MVDYAEIAKAKTQQYFPKFGSFRRLVTYRVMASAGYDPSTGNVTHGVTFEHSLYVIFLSFGQTGNTSADREFDDVPILSIDRKVLIPAGDLPVAPVKGDQISEDGKLWRVIGINNDPKPALYSLHVRPWGVTP